MGYNQTMKTTHFIIALLALTSLAACALVQTAIVPASPDSTNTGEYAEPDPETCVDFMPIIREYFHYRKQAIILSNMDQFWARFPGLRQGVDIEKGINLEEFTMTGYKGLNPFDGNIFPEYYERIKVKMTPDGTEVLIHGMELYLWMDDYGNFSDSGGEFKIVLYLQKKGARWNVYKTDEVTLSEWHQSSP